MTFCDIRTYRFHSHRSFFVQVFSRSKDGEHIEVGVLLLVSFVIGFSSDYLIQSKLLSLQITGKEGRNGDFSSMPDGACRRRSLG